MDGTTISMPKVGFVCCIEYGALEQEVVRLVGSLRKWGGEFAECEVLAVQPRFGPALRRQTLPALEKLGVRFVRRQRRDQWHWYHFGNKPACLEVAEEEMDCDRLVFLDSDMLITAPPVLLGSNAYEFGACARDRNIGTRGVGDPNEEYWDQMMRVLGKRSTDLPMVIEHTDKLPLRIHWNGGIFAVPRRAGFAKLWRGVIAKIFNAGVAHHEYGVQFTEQASLGIAAVESGMKWSAWPLSMNYPIASFTHEQHLLEGVGEGVVLHYHDAMGGANWDGFLAKLKNTKPELYEWLLPMGPLVPMGRSPKRLLNKALHAWRLRQCDQHLRRCNRY